MESPKQNNILKNKQIAIIGGGPGGLTLARFLQLNGASVKVYERDINQQARVQGAIVDLHFDSGLMVIEKAGLMNAFKQNYMPGADRYRVADKNGKLLVDEQHNNLADDFGNEHFRPEIDRGALRNMLIDALEPGTVVWDSQFTGMSEENTGWKISFKNGTTASADLVIGSDGHRSGIRPYLTSIKSIYSGATIIQGEIEHPETACPEIDQMVNRANLIIMGDGKTLAVQPRGDGGLTFYAAALYPENWMEKSGIDFNNRDAVCDYLTGFYADWNPLFFTLFKACNDFVPRPLIYFPLDQSWEARANLTLIGDAAHLMPPSGEGVNTAMLDAMDLSDYLTGGEFTDIPSAIAAYEKKMLNRAFVLGKEAIEGIKDFASPSEESIKKLCEMFSQNP